MVTLFADDRDTLDAWFWEGFRLTAVDAIRDLIQAEGMSTDVDIRRASAHDVDALLSMESRLEEHLRSAPLFLPLTGSPDRDLWEEELMYENIYVSLASHAGNPLAYIKAGPASKTNA